MRAGQSEAAAFEASASIRAQSRAASASLGLSHEPPAHSTLGSSRYDLTVSCVMPPVGQKRASGKGPANAFSIGIPPAAPAGKNLKHRYPAARPLISSDAVATAGRYGMVASGPAASSVGVEPGELAKAAPALAAGCRSAMG